MNNAVNAGITAQVGFELQRNLAIYLLLDNYHTYKNTNYFICLEHKDDFLFAFTSDDFQTLKTINTYQSKKKSGSIWTINKDFSEIITKILSVGNDVEKDPIPKDTNFTKSLFFISNTEMKLESKPSKAQKKNGQKTETILINEISEQIKYKDLPTNIKTKIKKKLNEFDQKSSIQLFESEIDNLKFQWVDFPRNQMSKINICTVLCMLNFHILQIQKQVLNFYKIYLKNTS